MPAMKDLEIKTGRRTEDIKIRLLALEQLYLWGRIILHYGISSSGLLLPFSLVKWVLQFDNTTDN